MVRLYLAAGARAFVTGLTGVLLGLYLATAGLSAAHIGLVVGAGLAGGAAGTAWVAVYGDAVGRRAALLLTTALSAAGLAAVASLHTPAVLAGAAFLGMVNGMGRDRGPAQTLEQSVLADGVRDSGRTRAFTRYTMVQDIAGALGALAAGVPAVLETWGGLAALAAHRAVLLGGAGLSLLPLVAYAGLPADSRPLAPVARGWDALRPEARRRVRGLSGLFALDSLGGGFLAGAIITYWFFRRFGIAGDVLGPVFFAARGLNALSYLLAEVLARRIGLVRTMVFTHLPSSAILLVLPVVPSVSAAIALFLVREALVQMDVPTRQSYVAAVTAPGERTVALAVTGVVRNVGWAAGAPLAGAAMGMMGIGAPLVLGAAIKIVYDVALYASYRGVRPPEEAP